MFRFEKEQSVWDFNGTKIGGQPGDTLPYWVRQSSTTSMSACLMTTTGQIDKAKAEALWNRCQVLSDTVPEFRTSSRSSRNIGEAFESYFSWFDSIDNKTAFLMDSSVPRHLPMHANM